MNIWSNALCAKYHIAISNHICNPDCSRLLSLWHHLPWQYLSKADQLPYSRFQVTFQSPVAKVVLNIPNHVTKFGILRGNLLSQFASCWIKYWSTQLKYWSSELKYWSSELKYWITKPRLPDHCIFWAKSSLVSPRKQWKQKANKEKNKEHC